MPLARLPFKPSAPLSYDICGSGDPLVVFINGLMLPAAAWKPSIELLLSRRRIESRMLIYDRFGQGETHAKDPNDSLPGKEAGYGHDMNDAVSDLRELLQVLSLVPTQPLVFVAASIGVHIARLYADRYPGEVAGLLLLDSNIGNAELTDTWPDPHHPDFQVHDVLADDCDLDTYVNAYARMRGIFNSDVQNDEGLDRRNVKILLPTPSSPMLYGPNSKPPFLVVAAHDPEQFANESLRNLKIPRSITLKYTQPAWDDYNRGLLGLSDPERTRGIVYASGCDHFIQRDDPEFVATEVERLILTMQNEVVNDRDRAEQEPKERV